jgi:[CysO sulfur-carrier protein]-S-L-cysteine hydrolase
MGDAAVDRPQALLLQPATMSAIERHLAAVLPNEGCGLLAVNDDGHRWRAEHFYAGANVDTSPVRFTMDPQEVVAAFDDMERGGWRLGAIVHSHPRTPATLSQTDLREAAYPDALLVVVSFASAPPEMRAWDLAGTGDRGPREVPIVVSDRPLPNRRR